MSGRPLGWAPGWALAALLVVSFALRVWYGAIDLDASRFWDERYSLENVRSLVLHGEIKPANGFHPSLSYLPNAAMLAVVHGLHRASGWRALAVFDGESFTPLAYLLCRILQAVYGVVSLWLVFLIGRRLWTPWTGFTAALVLSVSPWHLRQSAIYKPDVLLLLTLELAFLAALWALEWPSLRRYLAAGAAVGLAMASKFNAGPIAFALAVGAAVQGWRERRRWFWLVGAGLVAAALFLATNPFLLLDPQLYVSDFSRTLRDYERKGLAEQSSRPALFLHAAESLLHANFHGPWVGTLALAGLVGLAGLAVVRWRRGEGEGRWLPFAVFFAFPVGYTVLYVFSTTNPSAHNWLPLLPFSSLGAAWLAVEGWRVAEARLGPRARPALVAIAVGLAATIVWPAWLYTYGSVVPTNLERAADLLAARLAPLGGRSVVYEAGAGRLLLGAVREQRPRVEEVAGLFEVPPRELDLFDAEVFLASRLEGAGATAYRERLERFRGETFASAPFRGRGPAMVVLVHAWARVEEVSLLETRVPSAAPFTAELALPAHWPREAVVSLSVRAWGLPKRAKGPQLGVGGQGLPLERQGRGQYGVSRFHLPAATAGEPVRLRLDWTPPPGKARRLAVTAYLWQTP